MSPTNDPITDALQECAEKIAHEKGKDLGYAGSLQEALRERWLEFEEEEG